MNRFLMVTLGLMIASPAMAADLTPSFPSGGINPSRGIYGGMVTGLTITAPGAYAPSDLPVTLSIDGNQSGERARASVTAYTAVSARVASAGSGCPAGAIYSYGATGTKIIVSDGNGLSGSTVSVVSGGTGNASTIPANPVSMTAVKSSCTPPKLNLSWGVQSVSLDNQGWGYASPPSGTGSVSMAPDAAIAMVSTTVQTGVVSLPDKLVAASRVGAAGGVAGLDGGGHITAEVNSGAVTGTVIRSGIYFGGKSYAGVMTASPLLAVGTNRSLSGDAFDLPADSPPYQWAEILGGQRADAKAFHWMVGQPDSGNLGAVVDFVAMNGMSLGQGTGVSAGYFGTMLTYMNYDAAARATRTGATPPKFVAARSIADPDGNTHTVTFSATGATFSPALPAYWGHMIHVGMNVATNELGVSSIPQNNWNMPWLSSGFRKTYNMYFGTITSWVSNGDGTVSGITVDGWVVPQQATYGYGSATGKVPGVDTLDGSTPSLDTTFTNISTPAILFGIYTKAFTQYELCDLTTNSRGDKNNPNGTLNNLVHECDHEVDMWSNATTDYRDSVHGYTLALNSSHNKKFTLDSYAYTVTGAGQLPLGFNVRNIAEGGIAYQAMSHGSITQSNIYAPYAISASSGSTSLLQTWGNELATGGVNTSTLRLLQYRDTDDSSVTSESNDTAQSKVSLHLQWKMDVSKNPSEDTGAIGGQIVYNPPGYMYGIGIGAGGSFRVPNYGFYISKSGEAIIGRTGKLSFMSSDGTNVGGLQYSTQYSQLYENLPIEFSAPVKIDAAARSFYVQSPMSIQAGMTANAATISGTLTAQANIVASGDITTNGKLQGSKIIIPFGTPPESNAACSEGQIERDDTYIYLCVATNTWHRINNGEVW